MMMSLTEIETATREELADELGAACEYTGDWKTADMADLRDRVRSLVQERESAIAWCVKTNP